MRTHGTLIKWNDDRGFGFVSPADGGDEIFVHISAFPRDGVRPKLNEFISYETEAGRDGKLRAVRIMRPGQRHTPRHTRSHTGKGRAGSTLERVLGILIFVAIGAYGYSKISKPIVTRSTEPITFTASTSAPASNFKCDGRTMCSQMTSCAEAIYFLQNCPDAKMDGNHDGQPCEQQWCN